MNILFLNHNVVGRSTYHRCFCLAREFVFSGHHVTIVTNAEHERILFKTYRKEDITIVESPDLFWGRLRTGWDPINVIRRSMFLRNKSFDLIHAFDTRPTVILPALFYLHLVRLVPLVIDWSDWWGRGGVITLRKEKFLNALFSPIETFFEEYFRSDADWITVVSNALFDRTKQLEINSRKVTIIPNAADTRSIYPMAKMSARKQLGLPMRAHILVFPSFVQYDLPMVLKIFSLLYWQDPHALLLLLGDYPRAFGKPYDTFVTRNVIRVIGPVTKDQLRLYLSASDIGLLPLDDTIANRARFPMKFGDFLASRLPILTNAVGEIGRLVRQKKIGFFAPFDADLMVARIQWMFAHRKTVEVTAKHGQRFAQEEFSWMIAAKKLETIYQHIIQKASLEYAKK